jgi:COP9 signalosome complex subunit 2
MEVEIKFAHFDVLMYRNMKSNVVYRIMGPLQVRILDFSQPSGRRLLRYHSKRRNITPRMSDEEDYEYEYDDDQDEEMDDRFEYTDEEEEADDVEIKMENEYYNAKGLRDTSQSQAILAFEKIISTESEASNSQEGKNGMWSFKALKQLIKIHFRNGNTNEILRDFDRMLECIAGGAITPNAVEKGINGILDRVSSLFQGSSSFKVKDPEILASGIYDRTIKFFDPKSHRFPNDRLWFKTNLKYGQLLYETNETGKLELLLRGLKSMDDIESSSSSTNCMEIYALQIQLFSRQKDNKKLREVFNKALAIRGGIPHPRTLALIQELGGKMHMASREYESAGKTFFQAFKSYDEAGDPSRLRCLKYLVMASMLHASSINPFDSQEARPYRDDPEIVAMTNLVQAFQSNQIEIFEKILRENHGHIMDDEFVREHIADLLRTIRQQVLRRVIQPYTRISLQAISKELNGIPINDVESLLVAMILDGSLEGEIDQVEGLFIVDTSASNTKASHEICDGLDQLVLALNGVCNFVTGNRIKDTKKFGVRNISSGIPL